MIDWRIPFIEKEIAISITEGDELFEGYSGDVELLSWTEGVRQGGDTIYAKFSATINDERVAIFMDYEDYPASRFDPPFTECTFMEA